MSKSGRSLKVRVQQNREAISGYLVQELYRFRDMDPGSFDLVAPSEVRAVLVNQGVIKVNQPCLLRFTVSHEGNDTTFDLVTIDIMGDN